MVFQLRKLAELQTAPIEQTPVKLDELLDELVTELSRSKRVFTLNVPRMPWSRLKCVATWTCSTSPSATCWAMP